jgi:DNA processing protein
MNHETLCLYILSKAGIKKIDQLEALKNHFGSFTKVLESVDKEKLNLSVDELALKLEKSAVQALPYFDERYPKLLKQIFDPPSVLFYRGELIATDEACIAIVGTRQISGYGRAILPRITQPIIDSKVTIVSGLAYGVDAAAHNEAIKNQARTIAALGSGLDDYSLYPRQHIRLAQEILENNGLLLSEHPPGEPAFKQHFIARNRIIAGLSLGTIIIECKSKSGALITADYAMDAGRPVYAVPGPVYSQFSEGPHNLISNGAMLTTSGADVLQDLNLQLVHPVDNKQNFTATQLRVLECMQSEPQTIDDLQNLLKISTEEIITALTTLEMQSAVRNLGADGFIKT